MKNVNIYKVKTKVAGTKSKAYVVAGSFGEAISISNVKDDTVIAVKCIAENVAIMHLFQKQIPDLPDFPNSETSK